MRAGLFLFQLPVRFHACCPPFGPSVRRPSYVCECDLNTRAERCYSTCACVRIFLAKRRQNERYYLLELDETFSVRLHSASRHLVQNVKRRNTL